jgi:hypothetical protein
METGVRDMPSGAAGKAQMLAIAIAIASICNAARGFGGMESTFVFIVTVH